MEGRIKDFFRGLFGRKKKEVEEEAEDDEEGQVDDEDDFEEDDTVGGSPFVRDRKLFGQDYDTLKVMLIG